MLRLASAEPCKLYTGVETTVVLRSGAITILRTCCPLACRPRYWWWESVLLLQTLALVAAEVFGRALTPLQQALLLAAVLMAIGCVNGACSPIRCRLLVVLELMSLSVLSLTITLGLYFTGDSPVQGAAAVGQAWLTLASCGIACLSTRVGTLVSCRCESQRCMQSRLSAVRGV